MKKPSLDPKNYYTDPILFEEGFYKDAADELRFLKKVEAYNRKTDAERAKAAKLSKLKKP